jgi:riboflavin synthase
MGDVVIMPGLTTLPLPVERVLDGAKGCDYVLVLGWKDGAVHAATSEGDMEAAVFLATKFIYKVHAGDYDGTD